MTEGATVSVLVTPVDMVEFATALLLGAPWVMARMTAPAHTTALPATTARNLISLAFIFEPFT
jgi:hypothetical protein